MGMDHNQRSNAVGFGPSYLPDGEGARHGGGTYTGNATEPTIQDYENFFGPSARDIKTDLQRFKRHGRWHLPDVLQGPNPWLTDRIDGLITDATNSPFTTKILPYRFKEEVDGKIKWNVWSFDEGMASRVPYESAARTLTQSKRSFAGYMVRQGMAIVLEHNFMMTPKGRENFKNQLNQLIGSIQYTNDLDVHMALILAPSYQKTMRERYYTSDKSASQICREFADLFGMMQKNVNALDILIEEGKAILRTWGGPMPDFLLCNSKLTFQMTMTPDKTNYITQGIDGVKRLRAGPDLASYRGLSVIHTRSFAIETGQHPRDMLRRRVRTAEYYRILPNKKNATREFEFYNEERDTWFTLSFHDLLKCARYLHDMGESDNASQIDAIYHGLSGSHQQAAQGGGREYLSGELAGGGLGVPMLGRYMSNEMEPAAMANLDTGMGQLLTILLNPLANKFRLTRCNIRGSSMYDWYVRGFTDNLGFHIISPRDNEQWEKFEAVVRQIPANAANPPPNLYSSFLSVGPLQPNMVDNIFMALKRVPLNDPFSRGNVAAPGSPAWYAAYTFYLEIFRRGGLAFDYVNCLPMPAAVANSLSVDLGNLVYTPLVQGRSDVTCQFMTPYECTGSVNHPFHLVPDSSFPAPYRNHWAFRRMTTLGAFLGRSILLTSDVLRQLLSRYEYNGRVETGINILCTLLNGGRNVLDLGDDALRVTNNPLLLRSVRVNTALDQSLSLFFAKIPNLDGAVPTGELLGRAGVSTIPMFATSKTHLLHPAYRFRNPGPAAGRAWPTPNLDALRLQSYESDGHLSINMLRTLHANAANFQLETEVLAGVSHPWFVNMNIGMPFPALAPNRAAVEYGQLFAVIRERILEDPVEKGLVNFADLPALVQTALAGYTNTVDFFSGRGELDRQMVVQHADFGLEYGDTLAASISPSAFNVSVDLNNYFDAASPIPFGNAAPRSKDVDRLQDVELVIIRPNIEHNMLGVIMGLGGNELGNTLWGQTELSVYDDSMHGIWGMSYKYHERAIVFNEKNLIRMWDIAYDGYNGGKDDTYVDWTDQHDEQANSVKKFKDATLDLSKNYRGPSMMVMAYVHDRSKLDDNGSNVYDKNFRRNWPSPIVFYDTYDENNPQYQRETLPVDYDNVQTVDVEEFRVFNNQLYTRPYKDYQRMMPEFKTLHVTRKTAGQGSADAETGTDCLAFQGSMRIKDGGVVQEIQGSGHHGPDYVGVASVRAGKGQKVSGQAPTPYRIV